MAASSDRLLPLSAAADRLGCSYETLRRWANKGALEGAQRVGITGRIRVPETTVEALAADCPHISQKSHTHISGK